MSKLRIGSIRTPPQIPPRPTPRPPARPSPARPANGLRATPRPARTQTRPPNAQRPARPTTRPPARPQNNRPRPAGQQRPPARPSRTQPRTQQPRTQQLLNPRPTARPPRVPPVIQSHFDSALAGKYQSQIDSTGRVVSNEGWLTLAKGESPKTKSTEGKDRGHLIGKQFGGLGGLSNIVNMDPRINRSFINAFEGCLADHVRSGMVLYLRAYSRFSSCRS